VIEQMHCLQQEFTWTQEPRPLPHFLSQPLLVEHSGRQQLRAPNRSNAAAEGAGVPRVAVGQDVESALRKSSEAAGAGTAAAGASAANNGPAARPKASMIIQIEKVFFIAVLLQLRGGTIPIPYFRGVRSGSARDTGVRGLE
jgi:hypothetical protein